MARAKQDLHRRPRGVLGAAAADPRRRRLRRPGRGGRDAQPVDASRATGSAAPIHLVINNQLGFTTPPDVGPLVGVLPPTSPRWSQAPIFHVNGDDPEACVRVARLAFAYRQRFHKDVVIDMVCYRRHGHNEGDDPSYTQPLMYKRIDARRSVRKLYTEALVKRGDISIEEAEAALDDFQAKLQAALDETRSHAPTEDHRGHAARRRPSACCPTSRPASTATTLDAVYDAPRRRARGLHRPPEAGQAVRGPRRRCSPSGEVDWALAEALAFGSLLLEGTDIRLAGQDTRRGTFSQRHSVLVDYETGAEYAPLAHLDPEQGEVLDLRLAASEYAALGFEYGYSVVAQGRARGLGGAVRRLRQRRPDHHRPVHRRRRGQVGPDLRPRAAAAPRLRGPGPRALLGPHRAVPHAVRRGQHPGVPTRPPSAQYFHLLRRQMRREVRKPLVVFTPEVAAAGQVGPLAGRRAHCRARSRRCSTTPAVADPSDGRSASSSAPARSATTPSPGATSRERARSRSCGSSSCTRSPRSSSPSCWRSTPTPPRSSGSRRSPTTWARGPS